MKQMARATTVVVDTKEITKEDWQKMIGTRADATHLPRPSYIHQNKKGAIWPVPYESADVLNQTLGMQDYGYSSKCLKLFDMARDAGAEMICFMKDGPPLEEVIHPAAHDPAKPDERLFFVGLTVTMNNVPAGKSLDRDELISYLQKALKLDILTGDDVHVRIDENTVSRAVKVWADLTNTVFPTGPTEMVYRIDDGDWEDRTVVGDVFGPADADMDMLLEEFNKGPGATIFTGSCNRASAFRDWLVNEKGFMLDTREIHEVSVDDEEDDEHFGDDDDEIEEDEEHGDGTDTTAGG